MEEKKGVSKKFLIMMGVICAVLLIILIIAIVVFVNRPDEVINKTENGGDVSLTYTDDSNVFTISNVLPTTDAVGMTLNSADQYYDFSVETELDEADSVTYEIAITKDKNLSTIADDDIKIYLEKQKSGSYVKVGDPVSYKALKKDSKLGTKKGSMVLHEATNIKDATDNYRLRLWLSDQALVTPGVIQNYSVAISVKGKAK